MIDYELPEGYQWFPLSEAVTHSGRSFNRRRAMDAENEFSMTGCYLLLKERSPAWERGEGRVV